MLTKNQIKYIKSLHNKKDRNENLAFLVEGKKSLIELLNSDFEIELLVVSQDFYDENIVGNKYFCSFYDENIVGNDGIVPNNKPEQCNCSLQKTQKEILKSDEITKLSTLGTNSDGIAIVKQKNNLKLENNKNEIILILDDIKDPGNLGTIIRIADWYGITKIIASNNTCEFYNPKVIISSMGSFCRINMYYTDLENYLKNQTLPIYGAFLGGENIHKMKFENKGLFLIIGNESNGISKPLENLVTKKITIPRFGQAESLNAGVATAIILDNLLQK